MELNCILWFCIVSYGNALVLHGISLYCMVLHDIARCCIVWYGIALYRGYFTLPIGHLPNTFCFISPSICFISPTNLLHFPNKLHRFPNKLLHFPNKMLHFPNQFLISPLQCCVTLPTTFFGLNSVSNDSAHLIPPIVENSKKILAAGTRWPSPR